MADSIKDRLLQFLREEGISNSEFSRRMGLSPAYIGAMRKSMPEEKVEKLISLFPHLNRDWLLYGEGNMCRHEAADGRNYKNENFLVPLLPIEAEAGRLYSYSYGVALADCERITSPVQGVDFAIRVSGDSMDPDIREGTILYIKKINDRAFIPWGHPLVIDTENGVLVKEVYPSEKDEECIEARSYNTKYPPIQVPKDSIYGLYRILGQTRLRGTF